MVIEKAAFCSIVEAAEFQEYIVRKNMFNIHLRSRVLFAAVAVAAALFAGTEAAGQDLVTMSSLGGSPSVFSFRKAVAVVKRPAARPVRTVAKRMESVAKIKKQYVTIAKVTPKPNRAKIIDPTKLGPKGGRDLPPAQASKLFSGVGEYYVDKADYDLAFDFFRDAIRLDDKNVTAKTGYSEALALKGNDLLVKDQTGPAKALFVEAIKNDPKNAAAYFGLGEVYSEDPTKQAEAIASYEQSLATDKGLTEIYVPLGILYFQSGQIAKADDLLSKALASSPNDAETQFFLGLVRASQDNRTDEALNAFKKAASIDPTYAEAFFNAGEMYMRKGQAGPAITEYQKAIALKQNYLDAIVGLGQAYYEDKKYSDAIRELEKAAKLKNDNWETYSSLGDAYRQSGDFNKSESNYNQAVTQLLRQKDYSRENVADLYSKSVFSIGRQCELNMAKFVPCAWTRASGFAEKAVEYGGSQLDYANLGWVYYNSARPAGSRTPDPARLALAKTALLKAVSGANQTVAEGAYSNLGAVQIDEGDFNGAIESLKKVVDKYPQWTFSRYAIGTAYFKVNKFDDSAKWLRAVVDAEPSNAAALSSLGYAEIKRKKGDEVKKIIERLRRLDQVAASKLQLEAKANKL